MAAGNVNNRKAPHAEGDSTAEIVTEIVGATMRDDPAHGSENGVRRPVRPIEVQDAVDSTHYRSSPFLLSKEATQS